MNEVDGAEADSDTAKKFGFSIQKLVKDVSLSQSGCEVSEDGLVMIDSGASVPSHSENRLFRNQTDQFFSEVPTEGHSKIRERQILAEDRKRPETV